MKIQKQNSYVVQSNYLIESHYRLHLQEKRFILWLVSEIDKDDLDFKEYAISIKDFSEIMGLDVNTQYKEMKKIIKRLMSRVIEIEDPEDGSTTLLHWLGFAHWNPKKGSCSVGFYPKLKPYLLALKGRFTKIEFEHLKSLKSVFSIRIFELLVQYENIGKRTLALEKLKKMLGLNPSEYNLYGHFKQRILTYATKEINTKTDYEVSFKEIKESRRVAAVEFSIKKKTHFEKMQHEKADVIYKEMRSRHELIVRLGEYGFSKQLAKRLVAGRDEEVVSLSIDAAEQQIKKGFVKQPQAMITKAINECWKPNYS